MSNDVFNTLWVALASLVGGLIRYFVSRWDRRQAIRDKMEEKKRLKAEIEYDLRTRENHHRRKG